MIKGIFEIEVDQEGRNVLVRIERILDYIHAEALRRYGQSEYKDWTKIHALEDQVLEELTSHIRERK